MIFSLKKTVNEEMCRTIIFQEKTEMFKKHFFLKKLQTDLSDMKRAQYLLKMKQLSQVFTENVQNLMNQQQVFSVSEIDDIFNAFLHTLDKLFTEAITELIQIC